MKSDIKTVGQKLYWSYANLAMAHVAYKDSDAKYTAKHYGIRKKLFQGLMSGEMQMRSFFDDERLKMVIPNGCAYCGSTNNLAADHVLARKRGGEDIGENLISACRSCNSSKRDRDLLVWLSSKNKIPSILLCRRYLKLATTFCKEHSYLDLAIDDPKVKELPFSLASLICDPFPIDQLKLWGFDLPNAPSREAGPKKSRYRIATWNIERPKLGVKLSRAMTKLNEVDADLLVLTESTKHVHLNSYPFQIHSETRAELPDDYWASIYSKWKIREQISTFEPHRTVCCLVDAPFGEIIIYAGIIPYQMAGTGGGKYGDLGYKPWQLHKEDILSQQKDWNRIKNEHPNVPIFVLGDFNQTRDPLPGGYGTKECRQLLTDALLSNDLACLTEMDFGGEKLIDPDPRNGIMKRIVDHICVSNSLTKELDGYKIGAWNYFNGEGKNMSDHCGIYMDILI